MEKFQIATPGGFEVEVSAKNEQEALSIAKKNWQTMPRIIAKGDGNVRVFERSNGQRYVVAPQYSTTDQSRVNEVLDALKSGQSAGSVSRRAIDEEIIARNPIAARAGEYARGTPFIGSYVDEAVGLVAGDDATAGMRAVSGAMQRQRPGETLGLNLAGGLAGGAGMVAAAPSAIGTAAGSAIGTGSRLARAGRAGLAGAASGATEGAIYGAGEGADAGSRAGEAGRQAISGAVGGGLLGGAAPIVSDLAQNVIGAITRSDVDKIARDLSISKEAATVIRNTFSEGGDIQQAMQRLQKAGSEGMIADAGPAAQALLDEANQSGGPASSTVTGAIGSRMARTGAALDETLDRSLGTAPLGPKTALSDIAERSQPARKEAYDLAYSTPIDYSGPGRNIEDVLDRIEPRVVIDAVSEANAEMRARGMVNEQIMATIGDDGSVIYREMPNVQQLDEIKKALQRLAYSPQNLNPTTGKLTGTGQRYNDLAGQLRDAVAGAVPQYRNAVSIGGDKIAEEKAFMLGRNLLNAKTEVEDVMLTLGDNPSLDQIAAAKQGLRGHIARVLGDVRSTAGNPDADALEARKVIKAVTDISSGNAREKIKRLMGPEADAILREIDKAAQSASVQAALTQNSKTFARQAADRTIGEMTAPGPVGRLAEGELVGTTKELVKIATGRTGEFTAVQRQRIYNDIAKALTEKRGASAQVALRKLDQAISGQPMTDMQSEELAKSIAAALYGVGTPAATRAASEEYKGQRQ